MASGSHTCSGKLGTLAHAAGENPQTGERQHPEGNLARPAGDRVDGDLEGLRRISPELDDVVAVCARERYSGAPSTGRATRG